MGSAALELNLTKAGWLAGVETLLAFVTANAWAANATRDPATPNIFAPASTPADSIYHLSLFVLAIYRVIFVVVFRLLAYAVVKFRRRSGDDDREPPQIYGSNQMELAWTVIPVLIVVVLFLAAARVIHAIEDAQVPGGHHGDYRHRPPILVGVSISRPGVYHCQRIACPGQRS